MSTRVADPDLALGKSLDPVASKPGHFLLAGKVITKWEKLESYYKVRKLESYNKVKIFQIFWQHSMPFKVKTISGL